MPDLNRVPTLGEYAWLNISQGNEPDSFMLKLGTRFFYIPQQLGVASARGLTPLRTSYVERLFMQQGRNIRVLHPGGKVPAMEPGDRKPAALPPLRHGALAMGLSRVGTTPIIMGAQGPVIVKMEFGMPTVIGVHPDRLTELASRGTLRVRYNPSPSEVAPEVAASPPPLPSGTIHPGGYLPGLQDRGRSQLADWVLDQDTVMPDFNDLVRNAARAARSFNQQVTARTSPPGHIPHLSYAIPGDGET